MNSKFEISTYGNLLIYKKDYSIDFVKQMIEINNLNGLRIFDHLDPLESIDFLKGYTFLKELEIECVYDHDFDFLNKLVLLERLSIGKSIKNKNTINFNNLKNLKNLTLNWRKNKIKNLHKCIKINNLCLIDFNEDNFSAINKLHNLKSIVVKNAKVKSLEGLHELVFLENIFIGNCLSLNSVSSINGLEKVDSITFNKCLNIKDFDNLHSLPSLKTLQIIDCGRIDSIQFIANFPELNKITLLGNTVVLDGNLTPIKNVKEISFNFKEHYNLKPNNSHVIDENINKLKKYK